MQDRSADDNTWNTERIVRLVALALLVLACLQIILPFLGALAWAGIIAITVWPAFLWLNARLGHRPRLAATLCALALAAVLVMPFAIMVATLGQAVPQVASLLQSVATTLAQGTPEWLRNLPLVGPAFDELWRAAVTDMAGLLKRALPAAEQAGVWALAQGANMAMALLEFLFAILIAAVLLVTADRFADLAQRLVSRLDIGDGTRLIGVVVMTVRSVSIGLVGTAAVQALIAALGFAVAGVPGIPVLGFLTFLLALIQLPTLLIWAPAAIWLYTHGSVVAGIFLGVYGLLFINSVDNFLRPWLISRGARLPFALILMGVLGGILAWGIIGLFIGPTLLAVAYSLVRAWMGEAEARVAGGGAPPVA